jgi:CRISPR-associated protein Csy1
MVVDTAIEEFLTKRRDDRIKKKLKANMLEAEKLLIEQEAEEEFLLENWLPKAAKRAGQLSLVSHLAKFSHPSAKSSPIIFSGSHRVDGFLYSCNASAELDVTGSAAAMDVFKFLSVQLSYGKTILEHLELGSEKIKNDLKISTVAFDELRNDFLAKKKCAQTDFTDPKIKQIYFPTDNGYHLLSILSPSGLIYSLRNKIDSIRFSDETKKARENRKKELHDESGFEELYNLAMIGYGGTKPQNISGLNSTHGGKAYLLPSFPPALNKSYLHLPQKDFFAYFLRRKDFIDEFKALHKIFSTDYNNKNIRNSRDNKWLQAIIDKVIDKMWLLRSVKPAWSAKANCELPLYQKIWLDNFYQLEREKNTEWLSEVIGDFARWIIETYEKVIGDQAKCLDDKFFDHIRKIIKQSLKQSLEDLR